MLILSLGGLSCQRKAPSPEECHDAALRWVAAELGPGRTAATPAVLHALEERVFERATTCLTTPYDRELLACVGGGGPPAPCFRRFEARRGEKH